MLFRSSIAILVVSSLFGCTSKNWPELTHKDHLILALPVALAENDPCKHGHKDGIKACKEAKAQEVEQLTQAIKKHQ